MNFKIQKSYEVLIQNEVIIPERFQENMMVLEQ